LLNFYILKKSFFLIYSNLFFFVIKLIYSQHTHCYYYNTVFQSGEVWEFVVKYNIGFITINAGYVRFTVDSITLRGKPFYVFKSYGSTNPSYDWIFKVREKFIAYSFCNPLKPYYYKRHSLEGNYFAIEEYKFDYNKKLVYSMVHTSKKGPFKDTIKLNNCGYDLFTAIYAFRNINFDTLKENSIIPINVIVDNQWENLYIRYCGKKLINIDGKNILTYEIKVKVVEGTIFKGGEDTIVYVTTDNKRLPIHVVAEILIGKVLLYIREYKPY